MSKKIQIEDGLCFTLYTASRLMTQVYGPHLKKVKLTYPQFLAMNILWDQKTVTLKEMGERLYLDSGTLTPLIKRLIDQKLVIKKRSPTDERTIYISLTPKGRLLEKKCEPIAMKMFSKLGVTMKYFLEIHQGVKVVLDHLLIHAKKIKTTE